MSSDPNNPGDGDPDGADPEEKKTRFVPRPDIAERAPTGARRRRGAGHGHWPNAAHRQPRTIATSRRRRACSADRENGKRKDRVDTRRRRRGRAGCWMGGGGEGAGPRRLPPGLCRNELGRPRPQPARRLELRRRIRSRARSTPSSPTTRSNAASICSTAASRTWCAWARSRYSRPPSSSRTISSASARPR